RGQMYLVTTTGPHGLVSNQLAFFLGSCVVNLANDLGHATTFDLNGSQNPVYVVDATSFVAYSGPSAESAGHPWTMVGTVTDPATTVAMDVGTGYPLGDQVDLCNAPGCSIHWNMAFTADDDCLTRLGTN